MECVFFLQPMVADAGIPMIALTLPAMVVLLIPVIVVEGFLCKKWLRLTTWKALKLNALSNLASTIIGVPLTWAIMFAAEFGMSELVGRSEKLQNWHSPVAKVIFLFLGSAWIAPVEGKDAWLIPAATLALLISFFFASYGVEYLVMWFMLGMPEEEPPDLAYPRVRIAVRNANLVTYGAMFLATSVWLVISLPHHWLH
jgi:hypothetical protein